MPLIISKLVTLVLFYTFSKISATGGSLCSDHDFSLEFPSRQKSKSAYSTVKINGDKDIDALTICLWLKPSLGSDLGLLRYFDEAGSDVYFALRLGSVGQIWLSIHGEDRELDIMPQIQNGEWHGLCVTWNKDDGHFLIYYDGRLIRSESDFKSGKSFSSKNTFTLGIGAEEKFNYTGMLGHVNIWPRILEHPLLSVLSSKCEVERGGLVSWPQFQKDLRGVNLGESCSSNEVRITHEVKHWKLNGEDQDLNPQYSTVFLEGRLNGHKAVYLDQTMAYIEAPPVSFGMAFTMTSWVKLLYSAPIYRPILSVETNSTDKFSIGFNADNQLLLDNWSQGVYNITKSYALLPANEWIHVTVTCNQDRVLSFFVNGMKDISVADVWQGPRSGAFEIGRYKNISEDKHRYFHGFLSDLFVFSRALKADEIGRLMGFSNPCTFSKWSSDALTPQQTPVEKYRYKYCPGIGECKEVRKWKPADCREVLLSGNKTSAKYAISPLNNHEEFEVFCDQETQGGGWTVVQQRINGSLGFDRTWDEYKAGFGTVGGQSEMWLGNNRIHSLTTQKTELLIELKAFDGTEGFAYYGHFHVAGEDLSYKLSVGGFSGNIPDKLGLHNTFNFSVTECGDGTSSSGWWFTPSCGEALLNSEYGHETGSMIWSDFPYTDAHKGKIKKTTMKIRRKEDHFGDYTLKFSERRETLSIVTFPIILTEFQAFTSCLWLKVRPPTVPRPMNLLRYAEQDGNFSMDLRPDGKEYKIILSIWPSTQRFNKQVKYPSLDGGWHHVCTSWTCVDGRGAIYIDGSQTSFIDIGNGTKFPGGGTVFIGSINVLDPPQLEGEITYMNLWDKVLSNARIEYLALSCSAEAGNVLQWSLFAAMSVGNIQVVPFSACREKEMYYWNFNQLSSLQSFDENKNHRAELTGAQISADKKYFVIEDQGKFQAENLSSELSGENGFTVSFSARQTALASNILKDDFKSLEVLRKAFPDFLRDHATWKRCYYANQSSWSTKEFHTVCDYRGPTLTIIRVREYVFGGFVDQSWGGKPADIGRQIEGFLFSLSNPFNLAPRVLSIKHDKASGRTDPLLGPSFGERELELFEDKNGRIMGYSSLGASFDLRNVSLPSHETRYYLAGSQHFYPNQVEVFYYHVPSTPLGLENQILPDKYLSSSSQLNNSTGPYLARLNEQRDSKAWCSTGPNEWLEVFLGKQYTLTHVALQSIGGGVDVSELKVQYEKTKDGINWTKYSKEIDGKEISKVLRFNFPSAGFLMKEAFIPSFQAVKVRFYLTETRIQCIKMEVYSYDAGCSQPQGVENRTVVPDEQLTASSTEVSDKYKQDYFWPNKGRLNHDEEGASSWGPYKHPVHLFEGIWFQVDLKEETEVTCIATQGRPTHIQWPTKYQIAYSYEGNDWKYFEYNNGVKEYDANSDQHMAGTNWLVPSIYGRFFRVYITQCNKDCRLRMELYGRRDSSNSICWFKNGLCFIVRRGRYHIFFAKENYRWEIRHKLIVNQWFEATVTWKPQEGLKFYVNGNLVASHKNPMQMSVSPDHEPFKLLIASKENGGGWSRATSIDDVAVWGMAMTKEQIKRKSEVHFDFDDNSRDWKSLLDGTSSWKLHQGCTKTSGTGPCDDVSRGGRYIYFDASQSKGKARFSTPYSIHSHTCLKFHYHMTGMHTGRLNVYTTDIRGKEQLLWRLFGEQDNIWREASIPVNGIHQQYQVIFEAVGGPDHLGDLAIDQIVFTRESCVFSPFSAMPQNSYRSGVVITSSIVSMDTIYHQYLGLMVEEEGYGSSRWIPCYRALDNGWNVSTFHRLCDDKGPTMTIIKKRNNVFGGFTERRWSEGQDNDHSSYDFHFWRKNVADCVKTAILPLTSSPISSFTASFWIKTSVKSPLIVFSIKQTGSRMHLKLDSTDSFSLCWIISVGKCNTNKGSIPFVINDGSWHHITVVWHGSSKSWTLFVDGVNRGRQTKNNWNESLVLSSATLFIGRKPNKDSSKLFSGRITQFNMWDHELEEEKITMLARGCKSEPGNMIQWSNLRSKVEGELRIVEPSSCSSSNYRTDTKAFIFLLNYTSDRTLFKKKVSEESSAFAIYSSPFTGPTFGESPFDFQIGIHGDVKQGTSQHAVSYKGDGNFNGSKLETLLAGASNFNVNDVEVLFIAQGASLCSDHCPVYHYCDEITGICQCTNKDPELCQLVKFYENSSHLWLLESVEDIKDLRAPGWGQIKGGVSFSGDGLVTDGVNGEVLLNHEGDTCATKSAYANCDDPGFTVSLSLKPWYKTDGARQTFFKSRGKFIVYQERGKKSLIIRVQGSAQYCLKEIAMPEKIWSHLAFTYKPSGPKTLTIYRNGKRIDEFVRDEGCEMDGKPEFSSSNMSLGSEGGVFAKAHYFLIAIWRQVLSQERIAQIYRRIQDLVPLRCRVVARIKNQPWNEDLTSPETDPYRSMKNYIISNVTRFYEGVRVSVNVNEFRNGSVIVDFTIVYNISDYRWIEKLKQSISSTGLLYNMPLELEELTAENVPEVAPTNVSVFLVEDTRIHIRWNNLSLPPSISAIFQGYKVFIRPAGSADVIVTTVNDLVNFVTIEGLEPLVTYNLTVAGYTQSGVGRESESLSVTTTLDMGNTSDVKYFTTAGLMRFPPIDVVCRNTSSTSIEVKWEPPSAEVNSLEIIGYELHFRPRGRVSELWRTFRTCKSILNATVTSLEKFMEYDIRVATFDTNERGNFSKIVRCFTDEDVPLGSPVNISAQNTSSTSIKISWKPVSETLRLGIISKYVFNITNLLTGDLRTVVFDGSSLSGEVRNLSKFQEYSIQGAAVNSKGQSNFTSAITCRTSEDTPDIPPANVTGYNISSTSIAVEFQIYSAEQLNGIIRHYVLKIFKANAVNSTVRTEFFPTQTKRKQREVSNTTYSVRVTLEDLEEYTMYSMQAAFFTIKKGPYSAVFNVSTDEGVLKAPPYRLTASNSSSSSIMVRWELLTPASVPGILLGYVLRIEKADDSDTSNFTVFKIDPLINQKNVTELEVYTLYIIYVAGYTRKGNGSFRAAQSWTDEGVPQGPPSNVTGSPTGTNSIKLSWLPVSKELQKGIIRGYQVKIYDEEGEYLRNSTILSRNLSASFAGLYQYSNYSLKVRAFTRKGFGPWSSLINVSIGDPAPQKTATDVKALGTSASTIDVTWSPISGLDAQSVQGYRVLHFTRASPSQSKVTAVGRKDTHVTITGLSPFTAYGVQIAAFSITDGNYTLPVYAQTWEGAPSAPPSNIRVTAFHSQSLLVSWLDVPTEHRNGIIRGYRLTYANVSNRTGPVITERAYSVVLTQLRKKTEYRILLWAFNSAGDGVSGSVVAKTGEDVPSRPPSKIIAKNHTSLAEIPISWEPVPQEFIHGRHVGYRVTYQAVSIGDLPAYFEPVMSIDVGNENTSMILRDLEPLVVYKITVAAISNQGPGPKGVTFGETCRCHKHLTTNWRNYPPYVNLISLSSPGVIIPRLLEEVINECCGECRAHGKSELDFSRSGKNGTSEQNRSEYLLENIDNQTDFSFPVNGYRLQNSYRGGLGYSPFVESAGVAFLTFQDSSDVKHAMFVTLMACWPVVVLSLVMAYIAGLIMWLLDTKSNNQHFPTSFIHGAWEGVWWSFVSMTTVGYGDRSPIGQLGRIFAVGWVLTGLVIIAITVAALTTALTEITAHSKTTIYGSKVGAIQGSPEYYLGIRRNAILNKEKNYHSLEELSDALINREVEGILVDTYAGGMRQDLFSKPSIRVTQIVDYQTAYGVVISGDSMRLRKCFHGYMRSHQAEIFKYVDQLVEPIKGSGLSDREDIQDISTGLFDKESDLYQSTLIIIAACAITAAALGLLFEAIRRLRERKRVHACGFSTVKEKNIDEMKLLTEKFVQHMVKTLTEMKARHMRELLTFAKLTPQRKTTKLNRKMTGSATLSTKDVDDISTL